MLAINLEKGRKAAPVGTVKKMGKYWYRKAQSGKWEYEGQGEKPGQKKFNRRPVIKGTPEQKERLKGTKEFKSWFGDSKVVEKSGDPSENYNLIATKVYHGTARGGFTQFQVRKRSGGIYGDGLYFTEDEEIATEYSNVKEAGENSDWQYAQGYKILDAENAETGKELKYLPSDKDIVEMLSNIGQGNNPNWTSEIVKAWNGAREDGKINIDKLLSGLEAEMTKEYQPFSGAKMTTKEDLLPTARRMLGEAISEEWSLIKPSVPDPEVYEVYLSIENPCDMDQAVSKEDTKKLLEQLKQDGFSPYLDDIWGFDRFEEVTGMDVSADVDKYDYDTLLKIKQNMFDDVHKDDREESDFVRGWKKGDPVFKAVHLSERDVLTYGDIQYILTNTQTHDTQAFTESLQNMGFDGIKHTGGWNVGAKEHKVWIAFNPTQVKSTKNEGSFDPNNPDILKSRGKTMLVLKSGYSRIADVLRQEGLYQEGDIIEGVTNEAIEQGTAIEMEHTDDREVAEQIALDHLMEDPDYYKKLATIEKADDEDDEEESERDKEVAREEANEASRDAHEEAKIQKSVSLVVIHKSKSYPDGTIRKHGGRTMVKKDGGWVPAAEGKPSQVEETDNKSRKKQKGKVEPEVVSGSPEMLECLEKVGNGEGVLLDDLDGDERKLYNNMTRSKLVSWVHMAKEEYRPELTEAGKKALADGKAMLAKHSRKKEKKGKGKNKK